MTNPQCYVCLVNSSSITNSIGVKGETLAVCQRCHVMVCGSHGHRDKNKSAFICILCDPKLLQQSAIAQGSTALPVVSQRDFESRDLLFTSVDDFIDRRPGYRSWTDELPGWSINYYAPTWTDFSLRDRLINLPPQSQELLTAAGLLILRQEIPQTELDNDLRQIFEALTRN